MKQTGFFLLTLLLFSGLSCQEPEELQKPANRSLSLSLADVDVFTATLSLETKDLPLPATLTLTRNGEIQSTFFLYKPDTTIYDSTLNASTDYTWQVLLKKGDQIEKSSNVLTGRTLDTTSHNFTWRVDTLGYYLSSVRDVAIVSENNIWAVGAFHKRHADRDSTVLDRYNAAHWDGKTWTLVKIPTQDYSNYINHLPPDDYPSDITCIWVVDENNIWGFSNVGSYVHFNGTEWTTDWVANRWGMVQKIWGRNGNDLYFVGTNGGITHYNGSSFTRIPYPDVVDFVDVWGDQDGTVRAVGNKLNSSYYSEVVRITPASATVEFTGLNRTDSNPFSPPDLFYSVWWKNPQKTWFQADNGLAQWKSGKYFRLFSNGSGENSNLGLFVRGNEKEELIIAGGWGQIFHYNRSTIRKWQDEGSRAHYTKCAIKGNQAVVGGWEAGKSFDDQSRAVVALGKRQ